MRTHVVTGGARGIGRAVAEHLIAGGDGVVVIDRTDTPGLTTVIGSAADPDVCAAAADRAEAMGTLTGWVNNAAVFRDAALDTSPPATIVELITANLAPAVVGSAVAVRRFLAAGTPGSIVNVSSHQAQRAVRGALPYATAKAAIEGLTCATAVDHGPAGIRANAVALGSIRTERYDELLGDDPAAVERQIAALHPLGRVGTVEEVAAVVAFFLSDAAAFVTGVVLPVDGGRAANGLDPEAL